MNTARERAEALVLRCSTMGETICTALAFRLGLDYAIEMLRSEEAAWEDIEPRALSDKDRGTASQWADWLKSRKGEE